MRRGADGTADAVLAGMSLPAAPDTPVFGRQLWRIAIVVMAIGALTFVLGWVYQALFAVFAGFLFGVFLRGLATAAAKGARCSYRVALAVVVVGSLVLAALVGWLAGPAFARQFEQLVTQVPAALEQAASQVRSVPLIGPLVERAPQPAAVVGAAARVFRDGFEALAAGLVAAVIGLYMAIDPEAYSRTVLSLVHPARRPRAAEVLARVTGTLMRWLVGRVILMAVVGVVTFAGLAIAGVPLPFALGLLAGTLTFVPYLGVLLSIAPALLLALTRGPLHMLWVVVVFAIAHGLEGYLLSPLMAKRTVQFPPAFTIALQIVLGAIWGVLGFMFATPVGVVATTIVQMLYVEDTLGEAPRPSPAGPRG